MLRRIRKGEQKHLRNHRYWLREQLFSFGDDFYIQNDAGQRIFHIDGKMLYIRDTLDFNDMQGNVLLQIQEKFLRMRDTMNIEHAGRTVASVQSTLISPLRDRYKIDIPDCSDMIAQGNFLKHEYEIRQHGMKIAEISKKWIRFADTYGVEISPGQNDILILAIAVCIDAMSHPEDE
jgi:uncharacterized protein YxjI